MKKFYVPVHDEDEAVIFDLPDGAQCIQVGAMCPDHGYLDRRIVSVNWRGRTFSCSPDNVGPAPHIEHYEWPSIAFRMDHDDRTLASVYEGDAPPFIVRGLVMTAEEFEAAR